MDVEVLSLTEREVNNPYYRYYTERTDLVGKNEIRITEYISCYDEFYPDSDDVFYLPKQVGEKDVHVVTGRTTFSYEYKFLESIHKIYIPNNIIFCHVAWLIDAINLERFEVEEGNQAYCEKDGILYSKDMKILYKCPRHLKDKDGVTVNKVCIPNGVEYIYPQAFDCCAELETIDLPSSLVYIGTQAFCKCSSLKSISIPNSVKCIDGYHYPDTWKPAMMPPGVFDGCENLQVVDYGMLTTLPKRIFEGCKSLESFIGKNVSEVLEAAFGGCRNLKKVDVPTEDIINKIIKSISEW